MEGFELSNIGLIPVAGTNLNYGLVAKSAAANALRAFSRNGVGVRVPPRLPTMKNKIRNAYASPAKNRKAGVIKSKKHKRKNGKNIQKEFLSEEYLSK